MSTVYLNDYFVTSLAIRDEPGLNAIGDAEIVPVLVDMTYVISGQRKRAQVCKIIPRSVLGKIILYMPLSVL